MNEHIKEIAVARGRQQRLMREAADERRIKVAFAERNGGRRRGILTITSILRRLFSQVGRPKIEVSFDYVEPRTDYVQSH